LAEVLGLILARGGSTRVPGKNIRKLAGHPLVAYTISAARQSCLSRVVLSTDDPRIVEVARTYGADVPFLRPAELATETASSLAAIRHTLTWLAREEGYNPDIVAYLSPTNPLRRLETIDKVVALLLARPDLDSAVTVTLAAHHPYFLYSKDEHGHLKSLGLNVEGVQRSQDLPSFWCPIHAVFASRPACLWVDRLGAPCFNPENAVGVEIDRFEALDIDTMEEFQLAEVLVGAGPDRVPAPKTSDAGGFRP
jgi:CMP-N-acetylneuraminic acid synthetase